MVDTIIYIFLLIAAATLIYDIRLTYKEDKEIQNLFLDLEKRVRRIEQILNRSNKL